MIPAMSSAHAPNSQALLHSVMQESDAAISYSNLPTIVRILDDACAKRATLTLRVESGGRVHIYHSRIQSIDTVRMQMVLHRLMPSHWSELITREFDVEVSCQLPSGLLRFNSTLAPLDADGASPYCVLSLPTLLHKHQLRSSYRVMMPPGASMLTLVHEGRTLQGYCLNLSLEGCGGIFRGELATLLRETEVPALTVDVHGELQFTTSATVCRHQVMPNGSTQLGLRFDSLDADLQRKLQACLTSLQRRQLRRHER